MIGEPKLRLSGKAEIGRDICRAIREQINNLRRNGVEPKVCWISQYSADCMHQMWTDVAGSYDGTLPDKLAGVPVKVGNGIGRSQYVFEYHDDKEVAHTLRRGPVANPLPDNE